MPPGVPSTAASPEPFFAADGHHAVEIGADLVPRLQRFFDANPGYFLAVNGEVAGPGEADEEVHGTLPTGWPFTRKWVVGIIDGSGELVAMMNVVSLAFSPDNKALAVGTNVGTVTLWDVSCTRFIVWLSATGLELEPKTYREIFAAGDSAVAFRILK